jgi:riboflavin kinase / FMN adenylyltransferase
MRVLSTIDELPAGLRFVFTLGIFDGVHRGHRRALQRTVAAAGEHGAESVVITFEPHPAQVLRGSAPPLLTDPAERLSRLARAGVETTVVQRFDVEFAAQSAEQFLRRLADGRDLAAILMTAESAFGHAREGTLAEATRLSDPLGFSVIEVPQLAIAGIPVSSSRLRGMIETGRLAQARQLLGRDYAVIGEVVRGDGRGRKLGYPTANLGFEQPVAKPRDGIYAVRVSWGGDDPLAPSRRAGGVASLGTRPTFGGGERVLEVFLFDVDEVLYGQRLRVEFARRQRGEKRFASVDALIRQIDSDARRARLILARTQR